MAMRQPRRPSRPALDVRVDLDDAEPADFVALVTALARDAAREAWAKADKSSASASEMRHHGERPRRAPRN